MPVAGTNAPPRKISRCARRSTVMSPPAAFVMPWFRSMTKEAPAAPRVSSKRLLESSTRGVFQDWLPPERTERRPVPAPKFVPAAVTLTAPTVTVEPMSPPKVTVPLPALTLRLNAPLMAELKTMLAGEEEATTLPVIAMKPSRPAAGAVAAALAAAAA